MGGSHARRQQRGHAALLVLGGVVMVALGVLLFWLWLPLLIAVAAGGLVFVLLSQVGRIGWMLEGRRALRDPALRMEDGRLRTPVWLPFYAMLAALVATACGWMVLFLLPDSLHPAEMVQMGTGLAGAIVVLVAVWLLGQLSTGWSLLRQGQAWNARRMSPEWWVWAAIAFVPAMLAMGLLAPDRAGLQAWGLQWRGYDSQPLRIQLASASHPEQARLRDAALLELVQPLLVQGSRRIRASMRSRHGSSHWTAALPARYRLQGDVLDIQLAGRLDPEGLQHYAQQLQQLGAGDHAALRWLAAAQCLPAPSAMAALSAAARRAQGAQMQACAQQRSQALQTLGAQLQGQILQVELLPLAHYRPWPRRGGWQAVALPTGDEALNDLPMLAH
ncbi:hypothetical protein [Comamonas sp. B21-038]|uniref:hypothetical protein n=1 Tax=Comamonas sp. B21-038 TaxID=2918299 RepID=UPI001EFBD8CD|nr:hypothetical protein [Comamonas sp. B21-038]ULR88797.1 hypothetical protein MJ205_20590 [Comamonas sp. B21-038]